MADSVMVVVACSGDTEGGHVDAQEYRRGRSVGVVELRVVISIKLTLRLRFRTHRSRSGLAFVVRIPHPGGYLPRLSPPRAHLGVRGRDQLDLRGDSHRVWEDQDVDGCECEGV